MSKTLEKTHLHYTRIDISEETREKLTVVLNRALAQLIDLRLQVKQAHWNVKGIRFIALHEMFDAMYAELDVPVDTVAERITTLGGIAKGTLAQVSQSTELKDYPLDAVSGEEHLHALIDRYAQVANLIRKSIDEADKLEDKDTADLFTGVSRSLDMRLWFLEAHFQDKD